MNTQHAELYRMITDDLVCPYGVKARHLLLRQGFDLRDHAIESEDENERFKQRHDVESTPQVFIEGERVGGYEALCEHLGVEPEEVKEPDHH